MGYGEERLRSFPVNIGAGFWENSGSTADTIQVFCIPTIWVIRSASQWQIGSTKVVDMLFLAGIESDSDLIGSKKK